MKKQVFSLEEAAELLSHDNSEHIFRAADELKNLCSRPRDNEFIPYTIAEELITELDNILKR